MTVLVWSLFLWTFLVFISPAATEYDSSLRNQSRIFNDVIRNADYLKNIRPKAVNHVNVSFTIVSIVNFDVIKSQLHVAGMFHATWNDRRLSWKRGQYGDIGYIPVTLRDIWKPEISLFNTVGQFVLYDKNLEILNGWVTSAGNVIYATGGVFSVSCAPDVTYFPFDEHECYFTFVQFSDIIFNVQLNYSTVHIAQSLVNQSAIKVLDGEWKYNAGPPCVRRIGESKVFGVKFPIKLVRRWPFTFFNVIIPILLLSFLNVCVYLIPVEEGERVSFAITVLLSYTVFMIVTIDAVPQMSDPMPLLSYFLAFKMLYSSCIATSNIIVSKIYHRHEDIPIPRRHRRLVQIVESIENCMIVDVEAVSSSVTETEAEGFNSSNDVPRESKVTSKDKKVAYLLKRNVTWGRVSMALDKVLMCVFLLIITAETATYLIFMYQSYMKDPVNEPSQICQGLSQ